MRKAFFGIDAIDGGIFEGYTSGDKWNGWDCPYFSKEQADNIAKAMVKCFEVSANLNSDGEVYSFDFCADCEQFEFKRQTITVDGKDIDVYPIGTYHWVWQEVENVRLFKDDPHFLGDIVISYTGIGSNETLDVKCWVFGETPYYWNLSICSEGINNHDDVLQEIKDEKYEYCGYSITLDNCIQINFN
ncbi:hypothetical protein [Pseudobacillus badius]|uniref:hypothetical protein n=1 Tax=Bacillus badius TaxID=1455 RepID=UPI000B2D47E5|nr:hypothetical protein [Bacillus badius]